MNQDELTDEDAAAIGRAFMQTLPEKYSWCNCPTGYVSDLQSAVQEYKTSCDKTAFGHPDPMEVQFVIAENLKGLLP